MTKKTIEQLLEESRARRAAKAAGLPHFKCACGQELWAKESAEFICAKCFGAFRREDDAA
jgi:hypothetical protein